MLCFIGGLSYSSSCTSFGKMSAVTRRSPMAIRMARSTRCRTWAGAIAVSTNAPATSLNVVCMSFSCW